MNILSASSKPKFRKHGKLPGKPSELIRIAIEDLIKAEKLYKINMGTWVETDTKSKQCTVCLAGSVMACRLKNKSEIKNVLEGKTTLGQQPYSSYLGSTLVTVEASPSDLEDEKYALFAINNLHEGELSEAFSDLDLELPHFIKESVKIVEYKNNKPKFKRQMLELADALEEQGY